MERTGEEALGVSNATSCKTEKIQTDLKEPINREVSHISYLLGRLPELGRTFNLHHKIGEGTFSTVFLGTLKSERDGRQFAIKHLVPTTLPSRTERELRCLQDIGGVDNVVGVDLCLRRGDCIVFVMPYLPHKRFTDYVMDLDAAEVSEYMRNLLVALRRVHSFNIIHRDVKPSNFLYDRDSKKFLLVDFGLAQSIGSRKPPSPSDQKAKKRKRTDEMEGEMRAKQPRVMSENMRPPRTTYLFDHSIKKKLFANGNDGPKLCEITNMQNVAKFQTLAPERGSGSSLVRVQNSQVKSLKPLSPLESVQQKCSMEFPRPSMVSRCSCHGRAQVCTACMVRRAHVAPRAGTPGFRPPEVLLKYPLQTTAVDMWACGVILLCILSGCYPFFRSPDDVTALAEIMTVFGSDRIKSTAARLGRMVQCSHHRSSLNLRKLCQRLRNRRESLAVEPGLAAPSGPVCALCQQRTDPSDGCLCLRSSSPPSEGQFPGAAYDLLERLLDLNPDSRITAAQALEHPFIVGQ